MKSFIQKAVCLLTALAFAGCSSAPSSYDVSYLGDTPPNTTTTTPDDSSESSPVVNKPTSIFSRKSDDETSDDEDNGLGGFVVNDGPNDAKQLTVDDIQKMNNNQEDHDFSR